MKKTTTIILATILIITTVIAQDAQILYKNVGGKIYIGVLDNKGEPCTLGCDCTISIWNPTGTKIVNEQPMTKISGTMLQYYNVTPTNANTEGRYQAQVTCTNTGLTGGQAFEFIVEPQNITKVITVTGTALNDTGEPITLGTVETWVYYCGESITTCSNTPIGVSHATNIINGTYNMQFEKQLTPNKIYKLESEVSDGTQIINITAYINS